MSEENKYLSVIGKTTLLELSKQGVQDAAKVFVEHYTDGTQSPAEGLLFAKKLTDFVEEVKANISDAATNELKLGKGEKGNVHGATVTEQMVGVRYDFSVCNDTIWNRLNKEIKEREAFLKTVKGSMITGDEETDRKSVV